MLGLDGLIRLALVACLSAALLGSGQMLVNCSGNQPADLSASPSQRLGRASDAPGEAKRGVRCFPFILATLALSSLSSEPQRKRTPTFGVIGWAYFTAAVASSKGPSDGRSSDLPLATATPLK